ncbi:hypothetical protein MATL_G00079330 [Megalops atlanticus]|uniref:Uncharacterized protein n=1 Tax=Megalops atlanticus TaxID=7932 RepID=A0A9D3T9L5_MEGAT|nr:hypothetical protein MATL_G00079330 [Megalops atlanticus]
MNFIKSLAKGGKEAEGTAKPEKEQKPAKAEKNTAAQAAAPQPTESKEQDPNTKDSTSTFSKIFRQKSLKDTQPTTTTAAAQEADAAKANKTAPPVEAAESKAKVSKNDAPKATLNEPQTAASKPKDSAFSKLFRTKADPSKAKTLEAKAENPAKQEEKKHDKSSLTSCFKTTGSKKQ